MVKHELIFESAALEYAERRRLTFERADVFRPAAVAAMRERFFLRERIALFGDKRLRGAVELF